MRDKIQSFHVSFEMTVKTRFAPSPTGMLHIGSVRTALFSWLYARHHRGEFILRIEDTDKERSTDESVRMILDGMAWFGLDYDEPLYFQTQRQGRHREVVEQLLEAGHAYYCSCSRERLEQVRKEALSRGEKPRYDRHCRALNKAAGVNAVIRFKNPLDGRVIVQDQVQGRVIFENNELDDLIITRSDGIPTYNLAVAVDDMDMGITHVIRGDDHLNNTPRQINILQALGAFIPAYAHIPMILGEDGKKLSKRSHVAGILEYREEGYLPEATLNYLARLGWSKGDQEIFSIDEMIALFDIRDVNKSAARIDPKKLLWLNQHYLKNADDLSLTTPLSDIFRSMNIVIDAGPNLKDLINVQKNRTKTLKEMAMQSIFFYQEFEEYDSKAARYLRQQILAPFLALDEALNEIQDWVNAEIGAAIARVAEKHGLKTGELAQPLRVAVTGLKVSPGIDDTLRLLGKYETLKRLRKSIEFIKSRSSS